MRAAAVTRRLPPSVREPLRRAVPPPSLAHFVVPGAAAALELRWAAMLRRAAVMTPEEHARRFADPGRRGFQIERTMPCGLCGGTRLQELLHPSRPGRWDYHVVRCTGCGFVFRHPGIRPDRLGELYASGRYARFLAGKYTSKRVRRYETTMAAFGPLFEQGHGRRLLDFGCGNGLFLDLAHERGFECFGVDLAADAVAAAREKPSGRNVHHGAPDDIPEVAEGGFDVITMWSVLAHLAEPVQDLAMLQGLLAPDGVLLILTVNAGSLKLKREVEQWSGFTPNHLLFSSPETLPLLLRRAGFDAVTMPPWYGETIEAGRARLTPAQERRLRRTIDRRNRGNMLRAAAFASQDGPRRWSLESVSLNR